MGLKSRFVWLSSFLGSCFLAHWSCWQNPIPCGCRIQVPIFLLAINWGLFSASSKITVFLAPGPFSIFKTTAVGGFSLMTRLWSTKESSQFLRIHVIRSYPDDQSRIISPSEELRTVSLTTSAGPFVLWYSQVLGIGACAPLRCHSSYSKTQALYIHIYINKTSIQTIAT